MTISQNVERKSSQGVKNRVVVFKCARGFFMTPIIPHTLPWNKLAHKFIQAKTFEDFSKICVLTLGMGFDMMPRTYSGTEIDEHLLVYEDWGTTGTEQTYVCPHCGYTEKAKFYPDGRVGRIPSKCLMCGEGMECKGDVMTKEKWENAIFLLRSKPGEFLLEGQPVKILKIVGFNGGDFQHQVLFRDWSTRIINKFSRSSEDNIPNVRFF